MPDIIIVDLDMPRLNGYGVCRRLREDPATAKTGILMLTGLNDLSGPTTGLASGADDHITKPFNINEVGARAQALLQRRK